MQARDPYVEAPQKEVGEAVVTELIVHGVGGAPPTDLLGDFHPNRVSGDRHAGFYRPKEPPQREFDDSPNAAKRFPREAFAWGGLTSGDSSRALWTLLLPFALMNASGWMHPPGKERPEHAPAARAVLRLLAALGTVMVVVMFAHLALDIVGYQCAWKNTSCQTTHWWLAWAGDGWFTHPTRVLAVAALVPLGGLALFWAAGWLSVTRFESYVVDAEPTELSEDPYVALDKPSFWHGEKPVRRLRRLHFQLGVATTAHILGLTSTLLGSGEWSVPEKVVVWASLAFIVMILALIVHSGSTVSTESRLHDGPVWWIVWVFVWALVALAAVSAIYDPDIVGRFGAPARLDGLIPIETVLTASQALLGLVLLVSSLRSKRRNAGSFFGVGAVVAQLIGWFMLISLWAGTGIRLADWFGDGQADSSRFLLSDPQGCDADTICYPLWFEDAAVAFAGVLVVGMVIGAFLLFRRASTEDVKDVVEDFRLIAAGDGASMAAPGGETVTDSVVEEVDPSSGDTNDEELRKLAKNRRVKSLAKKHRHSRLVSVADEIVTVVVFIGVAAFIPISVWQADEEAMWRLPARLVTASGWLVALVPLGIMFLVRLALRNPSMRRAVGGVFDVLTFFPRRTHPFAPPCYGERAVPQLAWRIGWLTAPSNEAGSVPDDAGPDNAGPEHAGSAGPAPDDGAKDGRGVVIRAHSQGTAVTAASLLAAGTHRESVSLMTYGSPLVMLYERHFPAYFGNLVSRVAGGFDEPAQWTHLYARSDVLGCRLETPSHLVVHHRVLDPEQWTPIQEGDPPPQPLAHSTYHRHPDAEEWAAHLMLKLAGETARPAPQREGSDACGGHSPEPGPETISDEARTATPEPPAEEA